MGKSGGVGQRVLAEGSPNDRDMIREEVRAEIQEAVNVFMDEFRNEEMEWRRQRMIRDLIYDINGGKVSIEVLRTILRQQPIFENRIREVMDPRSIMRK